MSTAIATLFDSLLQKRSSPHLAPLFVFDCDGTIIRGDIGEAMFYYQIEHSLFRISPAEIWTDYPDRSELDRQYRRLHTGPTPETHSLFAEMLLAWYFDQLAAHKTSKACADIVRLFAGFSLEEIRAIGNDTLTYELTAPIGTRPLGKRDVPTGIRYIAESQELFHAVREKGLDIIVISGSAVWGVRSVFSRLGFPEDRVYGIDLEVDGTKLTAKTKTPIPVLEGKVSLLHQLTSGKPAAVFSDSVYDIPLFLASGGLRVLVNSRSASSDEFFSKGRITRDDSWMIIEHPTIANG
jgi:phosphoserine phosphatase